VARQQLRWPPRQRRKPAFRSDRARWEGELRQITAPGIEALLQAFGRDACARFGAAHLRNWIDSVARDAIHYVDLHNSTSSGLSRSEQRDAIEAVDRAATALLDALNRLNSTGAIDDFEPLAGTLTAVIFSRRAVGASLPPLPRSSLHEATAEGVDALLRIVTRRFPLKVRFLSDLLPELWDHAEALQIQTRYALAMMSTDRTSQRASGPKRFLVHTLALRWEHYFGAPPDSQAKGMFVRVACAVAKAAGITLSWRTVATALREDQG